MHSLRWPAQSHRDELTSDRYLVLRTSDGLRSAAGVKEAKGRGGRGGRRGRDEEGDATEVVEEREDWKAGGRAEGRADDYSELRRLCAAVMAFVEPGYEYSGVAVTHNFEGRWRRPPLSCTAVL